MKFIFLLIVFVGTDVFGQDDVLDWNSFQQFIDVTAYQGGHFRLKAFVKVENGSSLNNARLWVRVDTKEETVFEDNMPERPITENAWKEYSIEGVIDQGATKLLIGGWYEGTGKYYYDNFSLEVKAGDGDWKQVRVINSDFEKDTFMYDWKTRYGGRGFKFSLTTENPFAGGRSMLIDGSLRGQLGKLIAIGGANFYYEEYGKGDTILLLHGNSESIRSFDKQIPELSKQFHIIAMDSRGQGRSTKDEKKMSYELMAEDVNSFLEKLDVKRVNILGWSDGGNIGLILAMKHPEKVTRLAVMGANLFNDKTSVDEKTNRLIRTQRQQLLAEDPEKNKFKIEMFDLLLNEPKINPDSLRRIQCPVLVMAGSKDVVKEGHTKLIASKIKNSKLVIFANGTHYEPTENPKRFNRTVTEFFRRQ
jgi:pimeloyl-ACP methyl ester carboxylesterase